MGMNKGITGKRKEKNERTWINVYWGIAAVLLVIGSSGHGQRYIYPFHTAAFFFIAGYTQTQGEKNILRTIWDGCYTLLLPYSFVFFLMLLCCEWLNRHGLYTYFFPEDAVYYGFWSSIKSFLMHGKFLVWWLSAGWICLSLFAAEVLHLVLSALSGKETRIYFVLTVLVYLIGYYLVSRGYFFRIGWINHDLVFIGFGFFGTGCLFQQTGILEKLEEPKKTVQKAAGCAVFFFGSAAVMYYFTRIMPATVNYPNRSFNQPFPDFVMGISGCILLWFLAVFLEKLPYIKSLFLCFGRNWMGIIFFHFSFFLLYPAWEIRKTWWWLFVLSSILMSVIEWKLLTSITGIRFFLGKEKNLWSKCYDWIGEKGKAAGIPYVENALAEIGLKIREGLKRPWVLLGCAVIFMICIPLWNQGIMSNDELQYYYCSRQGFTTAYLYFRGAWISQGRFMASIFTPVWMWLSMIGENIWEYRIIPVLSILLNIGLFGVLLNRLFGNKYFSVFCCFVLAVFVPITFASMSPNAYTTSFGIPFSFLLWAMILYLSYIEQPGWKKGAVICILMFIGFSSYEIFVTYVPLFCAFVLLKKGTREISGTLRLCILPVAAGITYVILYGLFQIWMPTIYDGNRIEFTVKGALSVLAKLAKVSFPGAFLCSPVCRFLNGANHTLKLIDYVRLGATALGLLLILGRAVALGRTAKQKYIQSTGVNFGIMVTALVYIVLPALPIAISKLYQDGVGEGTGHIALPVTYFTYFSATFLCCFLVWNVLVRCTDLAVTAGLTVLIGLAAVPVQYMNANMSNVQNGYFSRIRHMEEFLTTDFLSHIPNLKIYSSDLFATRVSLAIHGSYWEMEMFRRGKDIHVMHYTADTGEITLDQETFFLSYVDDDYFVLEGGDIIYLAAPDGKSEAIFELYDGTLMKAELGGCLYQNGYYIYTIEKEGKETAEKRM